MNELMVEPILSKEQAREQFNNLTEKWGIVHTFSFDELYDAMMERRIEKLKIKKFRKQITEFQEKFSKMPGIVGAEACPLEHAFADGLYIRTIHVAPQTLTVTKIHAVNHAFFLEKGTISILTEEGVKKFTSPYRGITKAGTQRIIYHHDEVVFTTVHAIKETDVKKIEAEVTAENFENLENKLEAQKLIDFLEAIKEEAL